MPNLSTVYQVNALSVTGNGQTDPFPVGAISALSIDISVTAVVGTATFTYYRVDSYGNAYQDNGAVCVVGA